jgi:hypothetical protein
MTRQISVLMECCSTSSWAIYRSSARLLSHLKALTSEARKNAQPIHRAVTSATAPKDESSSAGLRIGLVKPAPSDDLIDLRTHDTCGDWIRPVTTSVARAKHFLEMFSDANSSVNVDSSQTFDSESDIWRDRMFSLWRLFFDTKRFVINLSEARVLLQL